MLTTIENYCQQRGLSPQFVLEYIRKGKIEVIELPVFVEYEGRRIKVETRKFIKELEFTLPGKYLEEEHYARYVASQVSNMPQVQADIEKILLAQDDGQTDRLRSTLADYYAQRPVAERREFETAQAKMRRFLIEEAKELFHNMQQLDKAVDAHLEGEKH